VTYNNSSLLKLLFATFPPQTGDLAAMMDAYDLAIEGHDPRDVDAAVRKFVRGEVEGHNPSFAPSAALLGSAIRKCMNDRLDSDRRAQRPALPRPDIPKTDESRERVRALAAKEIARLASDMRTDDARRDSERKQFMGRVNERFYPEMDEKAMKRRLGFVAGDPEGDADVA
jgi:hypothetical protein